MLRVVIPVYNDPNGLRRCLAALRQQTYSARVMVVDDGSEVSLSSVIGRYEVDVETQDNRGSYAARNRAVTRTSEPVLAFCDADCVPEPSWLEQAVTALDVGADLVAGHVEFTFRARPSGAERFDAMTNMQIEKGVRERGVAKTANLVVRRAVFDEIGLFPDTVRSGGDVNWTRRATDAGFRLVYAPDAVVRHPARRLGELVAKQIRVGRGQMAMDVTSAPRHLLSGLKPMSWRRVLAEHRRRGWPIVALAVIRTWLAGVTANLATGLGRVLGVLLKAQQ